MSRDGQIDRRAALRRLAGAGATGVTAAVIVSTGVSAAGSVPPPSGGGTAPTPNPPVNGNKTTNVTINSPATCSVGTIRTDSYGVVTQQVGLNVSIAAPNGPTYVVGKSSISVTANVASGNFTAGDTFAFDWHVRFVCLDSVTGAPISVACYRYSYQYVNSLNGSTPSWTVTTSDAPVACPLPPS